MSKLPATVRLQMANLISDSTYEGLMNTLGEELKRLYGKDMASADIAVTVEALNIAWEK